MARQINMYGDLNKSYRSSSYSSYDDYEDPVDKALKESAYGNMSEYDNFDFIMEGNYEIGEKPSAQQYDKKDVPASRNSDIPKTVYDKQLENLKRSFKEDVEFINLISRNR